MKSADYKPAPGDRLWRVEWEDEGGRKFVRYFKRRRRARRFARGVLPETGPEGEVEVDEIVFTVGDGGQRFWACVGDTEYFSDQWGER